MNFDVKASILTTAKIHQKRLLYALSELASIFPLTEIKVRHLTDQELLLLELMTSRFSKLQDLLGNKMENFHLPPFLVGCGNDVIITTDVTQNWSG